MTIQRISEKHPSEFLIIPFDYSDEIGGATIVSATVTIILWLGTDAAVNDMPYNAYAIDGAEVLQMVRLGAAGAEYLCACLAVFSDGRKLLRRAILPVRG